MKIKHRKERWVKMPNSAILDDTLPYSAKRVLGALLSRCKGNKVKITLRHLANISGCSVPTVTVAVELLCDSGYIAKENNYAWNSNLNMVVKACNQYIVLVSVNRDFTKMPVRALTADISHAAFVVLSYIRMLAGNRDVAYPSYRKMQRELHCSISTVYAAIKQLSDAMLVNIMQCVTRFGDFACNTYQLLTKVVSPLVDTALYTYRL